METIDAIACDVSDYASVKSASREIKKIKKPVKAIINAAGVASMNLAVTTDESTVQRLIQTNLAGTISIVVRCLLQLCFVKNMVVSSIFQYHCSCPIFKKGESVYAASKADVL